MQATLSKESFRQKLAGLVDPVEDKHNPFGFREQSISLGIIMARLFSDSLDRKTLWERIGTGLRSAAQKRPEGGDGLIAAALDHVKAEPGRAAVSAELNDLIVVVMQQDEEWNRGWAAYILRHATIVTVHARAKWQEIKDAK